MVFGRALPYRFQRTMRVLKANVLRLDYEVTNTAQEAVVLLWAAHPQFEVDSHTRIVLPPEVKSVVNVLETQEWGAAGTHYSWPYAHTTHGDSFDLNRVNGPELRKYRKFYLLR